MNIFLFSHTNVLTCKGGGWMEKYDLRHPHLDGTISLAKCVIKAVVLQIIEKFDRLCQIFKL